MLHTTRLICASAAMLAAAMLYAQPSFASDTSVTCTAPVVQLAAGRDGTHPRVTIFCSGGSSEGAITYFAYRLDTAANSSTAMAAADAASAEIIERLVAGAVAENGTGTSITILTNLDDVTGAGWGCGGANCRIIDYVTGY